MKTIIIEDEPLVAKDLHKLISKTAPDLEVVAILDSLQACIEYFRSSPEPDLLFMDIQLSDGVSFDLLKQFELRCPIIFTTAYSEYAIRAFKVNSIDYLLKPIDKTELRDAIDKFRNTTKEDGIDLKLQLQTLISHMSLAKENKLFRERFTAHHGKSFVVINQTNIAYFVKDELIYIVTNDKQQLVTDFQTMEEVEDVVDPKFFYRANRQYIISVNSVESFRIDAYSKMIVKLKAPHEISIDISREKAQAFRKWIQ